MDGEDTAPGRMRPAFRQHPFLNLFVGHHGKPLWLLASFPQPLHPAFLVPTQPLVSCLPADPELLAQTADRESIRLRQTHKPHFHIQLGYLLPGDDSPKRQLICPVSLLRNRSAYTKTIGASHRKRQAIPHAS